MWGGEGGSAGGKEKKRKAIDWVLSLVGRHVSTQSNWKLAKESCIELNDQIYL